MTPWLLLDYGDVISRPFDPESARIHAEVLGLEPEELHERYWAHRFAYDEGQAADAYWTLVAGRPVSADEVDRLVAADLAGWARVDPEMLDLIEEQHAAGTRLALLSNAPHFQAEAFDRIVAVGGWLKDFEHVFVSARLGVVKPSPAIFERVLADLHAEPGEVTFVDDRLPNVEAARACGLVAVHFTGVPALRAALAGPSVTNSSL